MIKSTPKKVMEIIFIFVIPLLLILFNVSIYDTKRTQDTGQGVITYDKYISVEYNSIIVDNDSPISNIIEIPFDLLGFNDFNIASRIVIDYTALWFLMFIIWHLLYLFFDTLMHKVLLRKEWPL